MKQPIILYKYSLNSYFQWWEKQGFLKLRIKLIYKTIHSKHDTCWSNGVNETKNQPKYE